MRNKQCGRVKTSSVLAIQGLCYRREGMCDCFRGEGPQVSNLQGYGNHMFKRP
jgi:hypothetical protein